MVLGFRMKVFVVVAVVLFSVIVCSLLSPVAQNAAYHFFADTRSWLGISNAANVISNVGFFVVGILGLIDLRKSSATSQIKLVYLVLYVGLLLTAAVSAHYHYHPTNESLVYDRLPMTIVFMAFLSATVGEMINRRAGFLLFWPLLLFGIGSVLYWNHTQNLGRGDLRWYGLVQFLPIVLIPLIYFLFDPDKRRTKLKALLRIICWYIAAKIFEIFDEEIFSFTGFISGHTLKHLAAAVATFYIVLMTKNTS